MNRTPIEWVRNPDGSQGFTWNPLTGCLNNCPYCYARKLANTRLRERYLANDNVAIDNGIITNEDTADKYQMAKFLHDPFYPRFWEDKLYHAWGGKPKGIFVCDMSDLFGIGIPEKWTANVLTLCRLHSENRYYLLTKQPQNLIKFSPFPDNCWVGVTTTSNGALSLALMDLKNIEAKVKFLSFEPLLGDVGMSDHMSLKGLIDWVIIGAQTKPYKPPKIEWVEEIVRACDKAGIPVFLKPKLVPLFLDENGLADFKYDWAYSQRGLRQEMPK